MTPRDILIQAKEILIKDGWVQGEAQSPKGCCAYGAIGAAATVIRRRGYPYEMLLQEMKIKAERALRDTVPGGRVVGFNDDPCRTKDEVLAKFDEAIAATTAAA